MVTKPTLEQERAKDAWQKSDGCCREYMNLAKALPALIMNSGLMQTMAFLHEKHKKDDGKRQNPHGELAKHLRSWLSERFSGKVPADFEGFMKCLMDADPRTYQDVTAEAMAWLRWMRQMAAARCEAN